MTRQGPAPKKLVIAHLFPELLNLYGDLGNIQVLARRARWRGMDVEIRNVAEEDGRNLAGSDIIMIGGGPDSLQAAVGRGLDRIGPQVRAAIADGASLLAVCGGYQNLGHLYRSPALGEVRGPGLLDVATSANGTERRMVGGVVVQLPEDSPIAAIGRASAAAAGHPAAARRLVGFENHAGRTRLGPTAAALGDVVVGGGNDGLGSEGVIAMPDEGGLAGVRVGTYLHGPVLARNPHLADFLLLAALRRHGVGKLDDLDDRAEWAAHATFTARWLALLEPARARSAGGRIASRIDALLGTRS
jgi:CobQ-like glutamine amidotransferase family enzyme